MVRVRIFKVFLTPADTLKDTREELLLYLMWLLGSQWALTHDRRDSCWFGWWWYNAARRGKELCAWETWNAWSFLGSASLRLHDLGQVLSTQVPADLSIKGGTGLRGFLPCLILPSLFNF